MERFISTTELLLAGSFFGLFGFLSYFVSVLFDVPVLILLTEFTAIIYTIILGYTLFVFVRWSS